jgi:hypothetical protein
MKAVVEAVINFQVKPNVGNFLTGCETIGFSKRTLFHLVSSSV